MMANHDAALWSSSLACVILLFSNMVTAVTQLPTTEQL